MTFNNYKLTVEGCTRHVVRVKLTQLLETMAINLNMFKEVRVLINLTGRS